MRGWLGFVISLPLLALFGGAGVMAYHIGQTWSPRHNDMVIVALSFSCLGIVLVIAVAATLFMMYAYRQRQMREFEERAMGQRYRALPPAQPPAWAEQPPMIEDKSAGSWQRLGQNYDLWEEQPGAEQNYGDWQR